MQMVNVTPKVPLTLPCRSARNSLRGFLLPAILDHPQAGTPFPIHQALHMEYQVGFFAPQELIYMVDPLKSLHQMNF